VGVFAPLLRARAELPADLMERRPPPFACLFASGDAVSPWATTLSKTVNAMVATIALAPPSRSSRASRAKVTDARPRGPNQPMNAPAPVDVGWLTRLPKGHGRQYDWLQRQRPCDQPLPDPVWLSVSTDTAAYWRLIATRSSSSGLMR
jgi:hypothetical protein